MSKVITVDLSQKIKDLYRDYGVYVNRFRAFPSIYDGLKLVERRLLYSLFEIAHDFKKSAMIVGHCIGHYHPHGDISVYETLVSMVHNGLAIGQGNFGNFNTVHIADPAAMRYTEAKIPDYIYRIFKDYISYVPFAQIEFSSEPLYLPTPLPFCLIGREFVYGVGVGYRTLIPCYYPADLVQRLCYLLGLTRNKVIIKPRINCDLLDGDYEEILETGKGSITVQVKYNILNKREIDILSSMPLKNFSYILNVFRKEIEEDRTLGWQDLSTSSPCLRLSILDDSLTMETLEAKIKDNLKSKINFECYLTDANGNVKLTSIDQMLLFVYNNFKKIVQSRLTNQLETLREKIKEIKLLQVIRDNLSLYLSKSCGFHKISKSLKEDPKKVQAILQKYNIWSLMHLQDDLREHEKIEVELKQKLKNLDDYVYELYRQYTSKK